MATSATTGGRDERHGGDDRQPPHPPVVVLARRPEDRGADEQAEIDHRFVGAHAQEAEQAEQHRVAEPPWPRRQRHRHGGDDGGVGGVVLADDEEAGRQIDRGDHGDDDAQQHGVVLHARQRKVIEAGRQAEQRRRIDHRQQPRVAHAELAQQQERKLRHPVDVGAGGVEVVDLSEVEDVRHEGRAVPEQAAAGDRGVERQRPHQQGHAAVDGRRRRGGHVSHARCTCPADRGPPAGRVARI